MMTVAYVCVVVINILMIAISIFKIRRTTGKDSRTISAIFMTGTGMLAIQEPLMPELMAAQLVVALSSSLFMMRKY